MEILEIKNSHELNDFVAGQEVSQFLQSGEWADFQQGLNRKVWSFLVKDNGQIIASALVIKYPLPFGKSYLYCPRGPIFTSKAAESHDLQGVAEGGPMYPAPREGRDVKLRQSFTKELPEILLNKLKDLANPPAGGEKAIFLRLEPPTEKINLAGFKETASVQPKNTLILDLKKSEEELLNGFHPKTRYNIRLAEKKGVKVRISPPAGGGKKDIEHFWALMKQTTARDNFSAHPKDYYSKLAESKMLKIFMAEYEGKVLAINLVIFFGDTATYLHGASADEGRNLMAPHLLQWAAIKEAKKLGCRYYDFWGVAPINQANHPWAGVTRFKEGFGGQRVNYAGTWDLPVKGFWYKLYRTIKRLK